MSIIASSSSSSSLLAAETPIILHSFKYFLSLSNCSVEWSGNLSELIQGLICYVFSCCKHFLSQEIVLLLFLDLSILHLMISCSFLCTRHDFIDKNSMLSSIEYSTYLLMRGYDRAASRLLSRFVKCCFPKRHSIDRKGTWSARAAATNLGKNSCSFPLSITCRKRWFFYTFRSMSKLGSIFLLEESSFFFPLLRGILMPVDR